MFHPYEDISYDSTYLTDISLCLTNRLWNCTWYTSGVHKYDEKTEQYYVKQQGKTVEMWKRRKNNIAALWLDFHANSYFITVSFRKNNHNKHPHKKAAAFHSGEGTSLLFYTFQKHGKIKCALKNCV